MDDLSVLWRVRGSMPVPVESDDGGLMSRVADVFAGGRDVVEERDDYIRIEASEYFVRLPIGGAEFQRQGIRGWRFIRYDLPMLQSLPRIVLDGILFGGLVGRALVWAGVPPYAYASTLVAMLLLYWIHYAGTRRSVPDGLRRAFAT